MENLPVGLWCSLGGKSLGRWQGPAIQQDVHIQGKLRTGRLWPVFGSNECERLKNMHETEISDASAEASSAS